jgi:hypothetical protein
MSAPTFLLGVTPDLDKLIYPITKAQAEQILAIHKEDNAKINEDLETIRALCVEKCKSTTIKCPEHSKEIRRLWRTYYTSPRHGSWASYRPEDYITEMRKMFDSRVEIKKIHERAELEKRMHNKDVLCTVRINDDPEVEKYKREAAEMFNGTTSEEVIKAFITKKESEVAASRTPREREIDIMLANCRDEAEKRVVFQKDACEERETDTQYVRVLRGRWKKLFEDGKPYDEIYKIIMKDIKDGKEKERNLREKLAELQRAKAAHDKEKAAKDSEARQRILAKYTYHCTTEGCQNLAVPASEVKGLIECGICWKLAEDKMITERSYFCGMECMERDGVSSALTMFSDIH